MVGAAQLSADTLSNLGVVSDDAILCRLHVFTAEPRTPGCAGVRPSMAATASVLSGTGCAGVPRRRGGGPDHYPAAGARVALCRRERPTCAHGHGRPLRNHLPRHCGSPCRPANQRASRDQPLRTRWWSSGPPRSGAHWRSSAPNTHCTGMPRCSTRSMPHASSLDTRVPSATTPPQTATSPGNPPLP